MVCKSEFATARIEANSVLALDRATPVGQTDQLRIHPATPLQALRHPPENLDSQSESKPHPALSLVMTSVDRSFKLHLFAITPQNTLLVSPITNIQYSSIEERRKVKFAKIVSAKY